MAHHTEQVGFPAIPLSAGMKIRIRAISPTTDAAVAGVTATTWAIYGRDESEDAPPAEPGLEVLMIPTSG